MTDRPANKWAVTGQSVRGASHLRAGTPNQDSIEFRVGPDGSPPVVLAVSDGHGSAKSFRSQTGSRFAVKVAVNITLEFLEGMKSSPASAVKTAAERLLTADIVKAWHQIVLEHFHLNPFTVEELDHLKPETGAAATEKIQKEANTLRAYGATLLLAAIGEGFIFYLQLGDGDILAVSDRTGQVECPLPVDATLMANETTSLCMEGAQKLFRFRFQYIQDVAPALILASTDGYSNSFSTPDDFQKVGSDLLQIIQRDALVDVSKNLPAWLEGASRSGSGDDVTLGIICRKDIIGSKTAAADLTPEESRALEAESATPAAHSAPIKETQA